MNKNSILRSHLREIGLNLIYYRTEEDMRSGLGNGDVQVTMDCVVVDETKWLDSVKEQT